jgi:hypothetical protein
MKHRQDVLIQCPYYRGEEKQKIFCEGVQKGTGIHLTFDEPAHLNEYKRCFCKRQYNSCMLTQMLNRKWEFQP